MDHKYKGAAKLYEYKTDYYPWEDSAQTVRANPSVTSYLCNIIFLACLELALLIFL